MFKARDSNTVELFLEMDGLVTECDGVLLLHECIKNIPDGQSKEVLQWRQSWNTTGQKDTRGCSYTILETLSHQVHNITLLFWKSLSNLSFMYRVRKLNMTRK